MKRTLCTVLTMLLLLACMVSCGKKGDDTEAVNEPVAPETEGTENTEGGEEEEEPLDYENMTAEELLDLIVKDRENVTLEEYIELLSTYSYVTITEDLNLEDNITYEAIRILRDGDAVLPSAEDYIGTLMKSEAPQVRGYAVSNITSIFGVGDSFMADAKELIKTEEDPYVISCALRALGNEGAADAEIGAFLLGAAKHENARVRYHAAIAIGSSWNKGLEGAVDTMIELMSDPDDDVRSRAYEYAGSLGDERVIEPIAEMLSNPDDYLLHVNGVDSLCRLWYDFPFHENTSEAAYRATIDYFKTTPRSYNIPSWTAISGLKTKNDSHYDDWRAVATYFDENEFAQVMTDIVKDENASSFARSSAIDVVAVHCSKDIFDSMAATVDALTDKEAEYLQKEYKTQAEKLGE